MSNNSPNLAPPNYKEIAKQLFEEHNKIRRDPKSYIPKLNFWLTKFRENTLYLLNENPLKTFEGKNSIEEAIAFLSRREPIPELTYNNELEKAAIDHVTDLGEKGMTGHDSSNGENLSDRIEKYCEWDGSIAESLDFGFSNAENIILNLLIDDGVKERYQRNNLFSTNFKYIGIGVGPHRDYNICSCFVYAKGVRDLGVGPTDGVDYIQDYIQKTFYKKKICNRFQEDDPDAPDNTIEFRVVKGNKVIGGVNKKITKKIYKLDDKTQHIVEIEEN